MKQLVAFFSHPDDEAMGPAGTLISYARDHDIHVVSATKGQRGECHGEGETSLEHTRAMELRRSAHILGIKTVHFLGFRDGRLCNANYHKLADKISRIIHKYRPETIMTFEPRGISGHLDHVAVSMATSYVYYKTPFVKRILYYCLSEQERGTDHNYFIYRPPGYKEHEIDLMIDISEHWEKKKEAIRAHKSQQKDVENMIAKLSTLPKREHFLVHEKE